MSLRHTNFKGQQIALARRPLADGDVNGVATALLIIEGVMLYVADDMRRLRSLNELRHQRSSQHWILAQILKCAPVAWFAGDVNAAAERHIEALRTEFAPNESAILKRRIGIPACRRRYIGGQCRGIAPVHSAGPHA